MIHTDKTPIKPAFLRELPHSSTLHALLYVKRSKTISTPKGMTTSAKHTQPFKIHSYELWSGVAILSFCSKLTREPRYDYQDLLK